MSLFVFAGRCIQCRKLKKITMESKAHKRWVEGAYIQDVAPNMPAGDREFLISGICSDCFDAMWEDEDSE